MKNFKSYSEGQATIEYLFVLIFVAIITIQLFRILSSFFEAGSGSIAYILTHKLTTGVCNTQCFFNGFKNAIQ